MRPVLVLALAGLAAGLLPAQKPGGFRTFGSPTGFGNILAPGVGTLPPLTVNSGASFASRLGATVGGFRGVGIGARPGFGRGGLRRGGGVIPYAVPIFMGGFGGYGDYGAYGNDSSPYAYPQQPMVMAPPQPVQPASPPVVINQYYTSDTARPVMYEYGQGSLPEPSAGTLRTYTAPSGPTFPDPNDPKPTIWLIAFKDGSIYPALGYWIEDSTLHYITKDGSHNRATVDRVDRAFSEQLNRERGLEFKLPQK